MIENLPPGLYLIPTWLALDALDSITQRSIFTSHNIRHFLVETPKVARQFLKSTLHPCPINQLNIASIIENSDEEINAIFQHWIGQGLPVGLLSDAGCPAIADPGNRIVAYAHSQNILVKPLVGPSSLILALMASGLNGQNFTFHGYLPKEENSRIKKILQITKAIEQTNATQLFIETPYRNVALLNSILSTASSLLKLCLAINITSVSEIIETQSIEVWKEKMVLQNISARLEKTPAIFLLGK